MTPQRAAWRVRTPTPKPLPPSLDGLLEEDVDAIPVRITIVQDGVTTGWDDGALGFEDDAVWFSGRATSFRLAAPDILPGAYLLSRREAVTDGEALNQGLPLRHPSREVWVRVEVLTMGEEARITDERWLVGNVKRLRSRTEGGGESAYPPLTPRPGLLRLPPSTKRNRLGVAIGAVGGSAMLIGVVLNDLHQVPTIASLIADGGAVLLLAAMVALYDPGGIDRHALRRIAREEEAV